MDMELVIFIVNINILFDIICICSFISKDIYIFRDSFLFMFAGVGYPYAGKPQQPGECFIFFLSLN